MGRLSAASSTAPGSMTMNEGGEHPKHSEEIALSDSESMSTCIESPLLDVGTSIISTASVRRYLSMVDRSASWKSTSLCPAAHHPPTRYCVPNRTRRESLSPSSSLSSSSASPRYPLSFVLIGLDRTIGTSYDASSSAGGVGRRERRAG